MSVWALGLNHTTAPLDLRGRFAFAIEQMGPVLNGLRLGFGTAVITALLAETKLSNQGLGFMIMQIYSRFDMPSLYGLLIIVFILAGIENLILGKVTGTSA